MNFDGANESRPALSAEAEHANTQRPGHNKPSKSRRFMSISLRSHSLSAKPLKNHDMDDTTPMTVLSPRPTESEPWDKKQAKHSLSPFLSPRNRSTIKPQTARKEGTICKTRSHLSVASSICLSSSPLAPKGDEHRLQGQAHSPATDDTYQSVQAQPKSDSSGTKSLLGIPFSPSRTAALTSHPV